MKPPVEGTAGEDEEGAMGEERDEEEGTNGGAEEDKEVEEDEEGEEDEASAGALEAAAEDGEDEGEEELVGRLCDDMDGLKKEEAEVGEGAGSRDAEAGRRAGTSKIVTFSTKHTIMIKEDKMTSNQDG